MNDLSATLWALSNYIDGTFKNEHGSIMFFIRGTMWHYMTAGYSLAYSCPVDKQETVIREWKIGFLDFLSKLPDDLLSVINKERNAIENDIQLKKTIQEKVE